MFGHIILLCCCLCLSGEVFALCMQGSYLNLCGICVGGLTKKNEVEGLDRCKVCDGPGECVGCDGRINSGFKKDTCGLCLLPGSGQWNDCRKITSIYPSVLDLSLDNGIIPLTITGAGLKQYYTNTTQCLIQSLESRGDVPVLKEVTLDENDIQIKIELTGSSGTYRIGCSEFEGFAELLIVDSRKLNVVKTDPSEILVGQAVEVEIEMEEDYSGQLWCFVKVPGSETVTLNAIRRSEKNITCSQYIALTPDVLRFGVVAFEDTAHNGNGTGKTADVVVRAKSPIPQKAEYSPDLRQILIRFDQNIQVSDCNAAFSSESRKRLGSDFICTAFGDTLYVTPKSQVETIDTLAIESQNSIRAWSVGADYLLNATAAVLQVSKEKVIMPSVILSVPNAICFDLSNQPFIKIILSRTENQKLSYKWTVPPITGYKGRSQRENMLMWKNVRAIEAELNNVSQTGNFVLSRNNIQPGIEYAIKLRYGNGFANQGETSTKFRITEKDAISVLVTAFPSMSAIVAQVDVTLCTRSVEQTILKYRWSVDENVVSEDGRLLHIPEVSPGTYNITCSILDQYNGSVLGQGWTLVQVKSLNRKPVIFPSEIVVGTMDEIVLRAYSTGEHVRWSCASSNGEPCIAVGPKQHRIDVIVNVETPIIRIPPGTLAVGRYTWALEGSEESEATVIISPRVPPKIRVSPYFPLVDSTKQLSLNADIERLRPGCTMRWKVVRRKGYDYFDLNEDVGLGDVIKIRSDDIVTEEREVPLIIPTARGHWRGLANGRMYMLRLEINCPEPVPDAHIDATVVVNTPPGTSDISITPEVGEAINTMFSVQIFEATDSLEDQPLFYRLSYEDEYNEEISLGTDVFNNFSVYLPPGNITLILRTCDVRDSCAIAKRTVLVKDTSEINTQTIKNIKREIKQLMLSGDAPTAYGKAIIALKSLSKNAEYKQKLNELYAGTESAIRETLEDLTQRLKYNSKPIKTSFQFLEQSVASLKYFSETKEIVKLLTEFKNVVTKSTVRRTKRDDSHGWIRIARDSKEPDVAEANVYTIKAIFDLHGKILDQNNTLPNREDFLNDVKKYTIDICTAIQDSHQSPVLINSSIVTLEVIKLTQKDLKNDLLLKGLSNAKVRFNLKTLPRKTCAAILTYKEDIVGNTSTIRISDVYEVRFVANGTSKDSFKENIKSIIFTIPVYNMTGETVDCMNWNNGWKSACTMKTMTNATVTCVCKDSAMIAAFISDGATNGTSISTAKISSTTGFSSNIIISATTTSVPTTIPHFNSSTVRTIVYAITTTSSTTTTTTTTTATTTTKIITTASRNETLISNSKRPDNPLSNSTVHPTTISQYMKTTEKSDLASFIQNISNIRDKNTNLYLSGTFKIYEDYGTVVGKNVSGFRENLKNQLADQLKVPVRLIANLIIQPGSIIVTVLFSDTQEAITETAIKELVMKLHDGTLRLIGPDAKVLHIPPQELKMKIGYNTPRNTGKMRAIAYGVVVTTLLVIFIFATAVAYLKRRRTRMPLRLPQLSIDDHPTYRQFHNEFSLDGSSASLARYRRNHPFETETPQ